MPEIDNEIVQRAIEHKEHWAKAVPHRADMAPPVIEFVRGDHMPMIVFMPDMDYDIVHRVLYFGTSALKPTQTNLIVDAKFKVVAQEDMQDFEENYERGDTANDPEAQEAMVVVSATKDGGVSTVIPYTDLAGIYAWEDPMPHDMTMTHFFEPILLGFTNSETAPDPVQHAAAFNLDEREARVRADCTIAKMIQGMIEDIGGQVMFGIYDDDRDEIAEEALNRPLDQYNANLN